MGNVNEKNIQRERNKTGSQDLFPGSPLKDGTAFTFDKKTVSPQNSAEEKDVEANLSRSMPQGEPELAEFAGEHRPRSSTISEASNTTYEEMSTSSTTLREFCCEGQSAHNFLISIFGFFSLHF